MVGSHFEGQCSLAGTVGSRNENQSRMDRLEEGADFCWRSAKISFRRFLSMATPARAASAILCAHSVQFTVAAIPSRILHREQFSICFGTRTFNDLAYRLPGQPPLIPQLLGRADNFVPLSAQHGRNHGGIDPPDITGNIVKSHAAAPTCFIQG